MNIKLPKMARVGRGRGVVNRAARRLATWIAGLSTMWLLAGCGPIRATSAISRAETAVEQAQRAGAPSRAEYTFHRAEALLHHAKIQRGRSEFQAAEEWATDALQNAEKARDLARDRATTPVSPSGPPPF